MPDVFVPPFAFFSIHAAYSEYIIVSYINGYKVSLLAKFLVFNRTRKRQEVYFYIELIWRLCQLMKN